MVVASAVALLRLFQVQDDVLTTAEWGEVGSIIFVQVQGGQPIRCNPRGNN